MGFKLSKFVKHSYVVSEGVQTELSIEPGPSTYDSGSFVTPPKDVHHICDPRSLSKGIIRTPIWCKVEDEVLNEVVSSPVKMKKKPYLETNLDELYYPPDPCDHLLEMNNPPLASEIDSEIINDCDECVQEPNMGDEMGDCVIDMPVNEESVKVDSDSEVEANEETNNMENHSDDEYPFGNRNRGRVSPVIDHFEYMIAKSRLANMMPQIESSETVEQVCQRILNELLHSDADIRTDRYESNQDLFLDENSDSDDSIKARSRGRSSRRNLNKKVYMSEENLPGIPSSVRTAASSLKCYKDEIESDESLLWRFSSPHKRKPLGEVNRNVDLNTRVANSSKMTADVDESPLKSILPILPSHSVLPPAKAHASKWDREKTLII